MGIKNLNQFLKKYKIHETLDISVLKYTKIAIDTPMFLFKFKGVCDLYSNDWLGCFITLITFLRKWDIHPIFIFEGQAPPEKFNTQLERREQRQKMIAKTDLIESDLNDYISNGSCTPLLLEICEKVKKQKNKSLLSKKTLIKNNLDVSSVKEEIDRRRNYEITITQEDLKTLKDLLNLMGISFIQSSGEAEADCVSLLYNGQVDYIVSEDTDVLAYCNYKEVDFNVITSFNVHTNTFTFISKHKVLNTLNLSSESFRDFCIMCGTDYNKNIPRVGTETAYKFIIKYHQIENMPLDVGILNHKEIRKIFEVKYNNDLNKFIKWCYVPINFLDSFAFFIFENNIKNVNVNNVFKALSEAEIEIK